MGGHKTISSSSYPTPTPPTPPTACDPTLILPTGKWLIDGSELLVRLFFPQTMDLTSIPPLNSWRLWYDGWPIGYAVSSYWSPPDGIIIVFVLVEPVIPWVELSYINQPPRLKTLTGKIYCSFANLVLEVF